MWWSLSSSSNSSHCQAFPTSSLVFSHCWRMLAGFSNIKYCFCCGRHFQTSYTKSFTFVYNLQPFSVRSEAFPTMFKRFYPYRSFLILSSTQNCHTQLLARRGQQFLKYLLCTSNSVTVPWTENRRRQNCHYTILLCGNGWSAFKCICPWAKSNLIPPSKVASQHPPLPCYPFFTNQPLWACFLVQRYPPPDPQKWRHRVPRKLLPNSPHLVRGQTIPQDPGLKARRAHVGQQHNQPWAPEAGILGFFEHVFNITECHHDNDRQQNLPLSKAFIDLRNAFGPVPHKLISYMQHLKWEWVLQKEAETSCSQSSTYSMMPRHPGLYCAPSSSS